MPARPGWIARRDRRIYCFPDLAAALTLNPAMKILAMSSYHDLATPFYQTELDLARLGAGSNIQVRNYDSGHMSYLDDRARHLINASVSLADGMFVPRFACLRPQA